MLIKSLLIVRSWKKIFGLGLTNIHIEFGCPKKILRPIRSCQVSGVLRRRIVDLVTKEGVLGQGSSGHGYRTGLN